MLCFDAALLFGALQFEAFLAEHLWPLRQARPVERVMGVLQDLLVLEWPGWLDSRQR